MRTVRVRVGVGVRVRVRVMVRVRVRVGVMTFDRAVDGAHEPRHGELTGRTC